MTTRQSTIIRAKQNSSYMIVYLQIMKRFKNFHVIHFSSKLSMKVCNETFILKIYISTYMNIHNLTFFWS
jgi:hypothetical protein